MNCFNPEDYDDDITLVEMRSLGRKGFKKTGEYSALGDESLMGRISQRLKRLLGVIEGETKNTGKELLEDHVEELEDETQFLKAELEMSKRRIKGLEEATTQNEDKGVLLSQINEALSDTYHDDFGDLESAVGALIEEFHDAVEEAEDLA
jgi:LPS O-antigen subunit length determinant protein (WzzB/FepE family)